MRVNVYVYISGPITPKLGFLSEENVIQGLRMHLTLTEKGIPSHCPHLVGAFPSAWKVSWEDWLALDFAVLSHCTHVIMLPRWRDSAGAMEERVYADAHGIPVAESLDELLAMLGDE